MPWGEAFRLTLVLTTDPSSQTFAALAGWEHPTTREWMVMADHRDSTEYGRVGRKARPYPRPWGGSKTTRRIGHGGDYSTGEMRRVLDHHRTEVTDDG